MDILVYCQRCETHCMDGSSSCFSLGRRLEREPLLSYALVCWTAILRIWRLVLTVGQTYLEEQ